MTQRRVNHGSFSVDRDYAATPDRVFAAWTNREEKNRWFGEGDDFLEVTTEYTLACVVGGRERLAGRFADRREFVYEAFYQDVVEGERIVCSYDVSMKRDAPSPERRHTERRLMKLTSRPAQRGMQSRKKPHVMRHEVLAYGREVAAGLQNVLGDGLRGAYYVGSIALGGYVPGESDIDVVAVSEHAIPDERKALIADAVFDTTKSCPTRGLEFTLYRRTVAESSPIAADFEVNLNGGPRMDREIHLDSKTEPRFWYVIDRTIAHRCGVAIFGQPPAEVFAEASRQTLLDVMIESLRWHRESEKTMLYSVLNATRAWRFAVEDVLSSKLDGAAWARRRWPSPWVIDAAVDLRHGRPARLDAADVDMLLDHVESTLVISK